MYNENAKKLIPYLAANSNLKTINTEQNFDQAFTQLSDSVEPTVLLVRPGGNQDSCEKRQQIIDELKSTKDFKELNVFTLVTHVCNRNTNIGRQISAQIAAGKDVKTEMDCLIVKMLKKIIYSGIEGRDKFILSEFPDSIA